MIQMQCIHVHWAVFLVVHCMLGYDLTVYVPFLANCNSGTADCVGRNLAWVMWHMHVNSAQKWNQLHWVPSCLWRKCGKNPQSLKKKGEKKKQQEENWRGCKAEWGGRGQELGHALHMFMLTQAVVPTLNWMCCMQKWEQNNCQGGWEDTSTHAKPGREVGDEGCRKWSAHLND